MSRRIRILTTVGLSLAGTVVLLTVSALIVSQTNWFQNFVREKIVSTLEDSTGGKVDIGSFNFDLTHLRVTIRNLVLHGTEGPKEAPLFRAALLQVDLKLFSGIAGIIDLAAILVDQPQANLIVYPDGRTNVPTPKVVQPKSNKSPLETVVDLKIGRFDLNNGTLAFNEQKSAFTAHGQNLHAQLFYNAATPSYKGALSMNPLILTSGKNTPVDLNISLPVVLDKDAVTLAGGRITSSASEIDIDAKVDHLTDPHTAAHVKANLALSDLRRLANLNLPIQTGPGLPTAITADINADVASNNITVSSAKVTIGESNIQASGNSKDGIHFTTALALGQLGQLLKVEQRPGGLFEANGTARLDGSNYQVNASIRGNDLSFQNGVQRIHNIDITGQLSADPIRIALDGFRLAAFGGSITGAAAVVDHMERFRFDGELHNFDIGTLARTFAPSQTLPYDGIISGLLDAEGNLRSPGMRDIMADVRLLITPGAHGVPVSGILNADFSGSSNVLSIENSYIALPHTRLDLSGALDKQLEIKLVSHNLSDFQPLVGKQPLPIQIHNGGAINFTGAVSGNLTAPRIAGHLQATHFALEDRPFDSFNADVHAAQNGAGIQNGSLVHGPTQLQFAATAGLKQWKPENYEPISVNANIRNADLADLMAIAGQKMDVSGNLNATAQIGGTIGNPSGGANLTIVNGTAYDERFDRLAANVAFSDGLVKLTNTQLTAGTARIDLSATFQHPKNSFDTGNLQLHVASNQMSLDQFNAIKKQTKGLTGTAQINADASAKLEQVKGQSEVLLTSVNADASAHNLNFEGKKLGDLTATAQTVGQAVNYNVNSDFAGSNIHVTGQTQLQHDYPTTATAAIQNLPIEQVLAVAGQRDIQAKGNLSANAQVSGTIDNPQASASIDLTKALISGEPLDRVQGRLTYTAQSVQIPSLEVVQGPARIDLSGSFDHPKNDFQTGSIRFKVASNPIQLAKLHIVQEQKPGLAGTLQIDADGAGTLRKVPQGSTEPPILFSALNANIGATGIQMNQKPLGDLTLKAQTGNGGNLVFNLDSDLAKSSIHGQGQARLSGDYPVTAQVNFSNLTYSGLMPLIGATTSPSGPSFDGLAAGQINVSGPALKPEQLNGSVNISQLQLTGSTSAPTATPTRITIQNQGPIVIALKNQVINVQSAHLTGPDTDIQLTGGVDLKDKSPINLKLAANTDLKVVQNFDHDVYSGGKVVVDLVVHGGFSQPLVNGQVKLQNASFNMIDLPNGLSNANGVIQFNGTNAVIQNLTGESGGGKVTASGGVSFANGNLRYGLRANAITVRIRTPEGVTVVVSAGAELAGNADHSLLSGTVTVNKIAFNPKSDIGSMLSRSSPPVETPSAPSGPVAGMKLDVRIRTAPDVALSTSYAQNLQASADLTLRGTLASPGMLGRVNVTSGKLVFFGSTYDINSGSISFYDPLKIQPILDVNLETKAQGVDVILSVSGPVDNMKLTYRSDPPLQFDEIVALLATGQTPTSDPTILANQPQPPPQTMEQMGESAIVSQAVAAPVADRLQKVFGVSQLKIDPSFVSGSALPQARITLQQQIAKNITFTYITDVTQANSEIINVQWSINDQWSAVATRDQFGIVGLDFFYKKQFR